MVESGLIFYDTLSDGDGSVNVCWGYSLFFYLLSFGLGLVWAF